MSKSPAKSQAAWKQDTLEGLEKGSRVWYKAGANSWVLGTLQKAPQPGQQGGQWTVALDSEAGEGTGQVRAALSIASAALYTVCMKDLSAQVPAHKEAEGVMKTHAVKLQQYAKLTRVPCMVQVITCRVDLLVPANPVILDGVADLTGLTYLNEPSILHGLNLRYSEDLIYTHAGPVLIAINPFKQVSRQRNA